MRPSAISMRGVLGSYPFLYCELARMKRGRNRLVVKSGTDLVVEGYPRSGNTFALALFELSFPHIKIASHVHHEAHVRRALQLGTPAIVLVRDPVDAVTSHLIYSDSRDFASALESWIRFYSGIQKVAEQTTVLSFESVTTQPSIACKVIGRILDQPEPSIPDTAKILDYVEELGDRRFGSISESKVSRPMAERDQRKADVRALAQTVSSRQMNEARLLYTRLVQE